MSKACRKRARTCRKPGCKPGRKPGFQLARIMECGLNTTKVEAQRFGAKFPRVSDWQLCFIGNLLCGCSAGHGQNKEQITCRFLTRCRGVIVPYVASVVAPPLTRSRSCVDAVCWLRGTVVERWSLTGELSLSCARPTADGPWVNRPL